MLHLIAPSGCVYVHAHVQEAVWPALRLVPVMRDICNQGLNTITKVASGTGRGRGTDGWTDGWMRGRGGKVEG